MIPTKKKFERLSKKYGLVPLVKTLQNFEDPFLVYKKFYGENSFLLHSANATNKLAKYSYVGDSPFLVFKSKNDIIELNGKKAKGKPLEKLQKILDKYRAPRLFKSDIFQGGAIGYFSYDAVRLIEKIPKKAKDDLKLPETFFLFIDSFIAFDHENKKMHLIALDKKYEGALKKISRLENKLDEVPLKTSLKKENTKVKSNFTKKKYLRAVKKIKKYIIDGDTFQVNFSQRFQAKITQHPLEIYEKMIKINPSPFASFLEFGDFSIISCSPERLVKITNKQVSTRPIGGTRPRGKNKQEDKKLEQELLTNEKELAEHTMLVDLERNDLGKVCEYGTVKTNELFTIEKYSHVMHIVSNIVGELKDAKLVNVIKAMLPGGTITGCPKIRTMEIIEELEPQRRSIYTGSLGYFDFNGNMDFNILIRTILRKKDEYYWQVGGGIVYDSNPEKEYQETLYKGQALLESIKGGKK